MLLLLNLLHKSNELNLPFAINSDLRVYPTKKCQNQDPIITSAINSVAITNVYPGKFHKFINWGLTSAINNAAQPLNVYPGNLSGLASPVTTIPKMDSSYTITRSFCGSQRQPL